MPRSRPTSSRPRRRTEIERLSTDREKTGVRARRRRDQPGQRRADPDLHRRLRPGRLRDRRDHGRPRPRRARLRVRARSSAWRSGGSSRRPAATPTSRWTAPTSPTPAGEILVNSGPFTGMPADEGGEAIVASLAETGRAEPKVTYRLRDWLVSRQRYWGTPIPVIYCERRRRRAGARTRTCRSACPRPSTTRGSGDNPLNHDEAFLQRRLPALRRPGPARDRHDGHVHGLVVVLVPLPVAGRSGRAGRSRADRSLDAGRPVHRRRRARRHAPAVQPVLHQGDGRRRPGRATASRSCGCSTRARSWAPTASGCRSRAATSRIPTSSSPATAPTPSGCS